MAGIGASIEIVDRVSGALNRITASLYSTTAAFQSVDTASETTFNASGVQMMAQEMHAYEQRIQQLESDLVSANNRLKKMEEQTRKNTSAAGGLESAFSKVGAIVASLGIGMLVKNQVSEAIDYASDLTEVQNVVDTVFGDNSAVDDWAKNTLNAVGLNELSAKQYVGTMGAMLQSSGVAQDQIESMSMSITELAGDMASFYNLDADEAFTKIRSGLSGETEPLKQLGINMSVANLEAYALSQGIEASYSEMDQASQTLLRYNYLLSVTGSAQGDFSKTSGSYANQIKLLQENWTAFTGELATGVLPVLAYGVGLLNSFVGFIRENWNVISPILAGLAGAVGVLAAVALATKVAAGAQMIYNAVMAMNPTVLIIAGVVALIGLLLSLCNWIAETTGVAQSGIGVIVGALAVAGAFIWNTIVGLLNGIIQFAWTNFVEPWIGIIEWVLNVINGGFDSFGDACANLIGNIISWFLSLGKVVTKIIDAIFGTDWTSGLNSLQSEVLSWGKNETAITLDRTAPEIANATIDYGTAWNAGSAWGDGISDSISSGLDGLLEMFNEKSEDDSGYTEDYSEYMANDLSSIAGDTAAISDSVDISNENLKYLRDVAERDVINRFTTAEIKVDMQNNNTINNGMDIDGVISELTAGVQEAMEQAAEGVHE